MNIEKLRSYCLSFPGTTEGIKWENNLCFMVAEKIFCITGMNDGSPVSFKLDEERFDELTDREGIIQAPHFARRQWVSVIKRSALRPQEWEEYLGEAYRIIKAKLPKKIQKEIDEGERG